MWMLVPVWRSGRLCWRNRTTGSTTCFSQWPARGVFKAKPEGTTLVEVEIQSAMTTRYARGLAIHNGHQINEPR